MSNGDAAAAVGMDTVPGTADLRNSYDEHNKTRDYLAAHQTGGTHPASAITSGTLAEARIPNLPGSKITSAVAEATTATSATSATTASQAEGPTSAAYARNATGASPWYSTWMNAANQFMRNTSSRRYKKNIRDWSSDGVLALRPVIFDRRGDDTPDNEVGFIAEEVLQVLPEAVAYFDGKVDGIYDRALTAALVSTVQSLARRVQALEEGKAN